jgi:hypothetical protein
MKILILSLFILLFSSCSPDFRNDDYVIIIIDINNHTQLTNRYGLCLYETNYDGFDFNDTCNKFQIGDTVKITKFN